MENRANYCDLFDYYDKKENKSDKFESEVVKVHNEDKENELKVIDEKESDEGSHKVDEDETCIVAVDLNLNIQLIYQVCHIHL